MGNSSSTTSNMTFPENVVILHQVPRGLNAPSLSPFALKLETWLRMADINYKNEFGYKFSSKGKIPWITLNGFELGDSQFIIEYLTKKFNIKLNENLDPAQKGVARAFLKMTEESLFWCMQLNRFVYNPNAEVTGIPSLFMIRGKQTTISKSKSHGYGLHSPDELYSIGKTDLKSINDYIGNKKYLLGDNVCDADASIFGLVAQFIFHDNDECPNLVRYVETIKSTYWPDWNENIKQKS